MPLVRGDWNYMRYKGSEKGELDKKGVPLDCYVFEAPATGMIVTNFQLLPQVSPAGDEVFIAGIEISQKGEMERSWNEYEVVFSGGAGLTPGYGFAWAYKGHVLRVQFENRGCDVRPAFAYLS